LRLIGEVSRQSSSRTVDIQRRDYLQLRATVQGLLASFNNVVAARKLEAAKFMDTGAMQQNLDAASAFASRSQYNMATDAMRRAYQPLVGALSVLRANETVEYRLVFENVEAEFVYERRRLTSNELMLKLMLRERPPDAVRRAEIDTEIARAVQLKTLYEQQSTARNFSAALESAEAANNHLSRALRKAGVYMSQ